MAKYERQRARIQCDIDGYDTCWVEIDVTEWGHAEYLDIWSTAYPLVAIKYFENYCCSWHIVNDEGTAVAHPGMGSDRERWSEIYTALGVRTSRALSDWFSTTCLLAAVEAQQLTPKRIEDDTSDSGEDRETGDGGDGNVSS